MHSCAPLLHTDSWRQIHNLSPLHSRTHSLIPVSAPPHPTPAPQSECLGRVHSQSDTIKRYCTGPSSTLFPQGVSLPHTHNSQYNIPSRNAHIFILHNFLPPPPPFIWPGITEGCVFSAHPLLWHCYVFLRAALPNGLVLCVSLLELQNTSESWQPGPLALFLFISLRVTQQSEGGCQKQIQSQACPWAGHVCGTAGTAVRVMPGRRE